MLNVTDFGVIPDGYTCCVGTIERVLSSRMPDGGALYFPAGKYYLSRTLQVNRNCISLIGSGSGASQFISNVEDHSYIVVGSTTSQSSHFSIRDLGFNSLVTRSGGAYIHLNNAFNASITNCFFANGYISINLENAFFTRVDDCMIIDPVPETGIGVLVHGEKRHNDQYLSRVFVQSQAQSPQAGYGFRIANSQGLWMQECGAFRCNVGFHILATTGMTAEHFFLTRNHADNCKSVGWLVEAGAQSTVRRIQFNGDWSSSNGNCGWMFISSDGVVADITLSNVRAYQNQGPAIFANGVESLDINCATFAGNGISPDVNGELVLGKQVGSLRVIGGQMGGFSGLKAEVEYLILGIEAANHIEIRGNTAYGYLAICDQPQKEVHILPLNRIL